LSIIQTVLIFAGVPLAVILLVTGAVYAGGARRSKRYRPGRPFEFTPVWFLSAPEQLTHSPDGSGAREVTAAERPALPAAGGEWPATDNPAPQVTGGASDRW
jgi:hypothetical protein